MKISATTYVRNGLQLYYPIVESIRSIIAWVDEYIVVVATPPMARAKRLKK